MATLGKLTVLWKMRAFFRHPMKGMKVIRDERTPMLARVIGIVAVAYVFFPLDIVPDVIPFLGQLDDVTVALYLLSLALSMIPDEVFTDAGLAVPSRSKAESSR